MTMTKRPNILFILSDDQGAWALHSAGCYELQTPRLDRLAKRGTRFENFFCVSPVCSPARASIFTGTIPSVHGIQDWLRGGNIDLAQYPALNGDSRYAEESKAIPYLEGLTCYTDMLAKAGYRCGLSGKWHMGDSVHPQHGFTEWYTIAKGGCPYYKPDMVRDGNIETLEGQYVTDLITDDAISNLQKYAKGNQPFYLSVHYTAPHAPWDEANHPKKFLDLYRDTDFPSVANEPLHPWLTLAAPYKPGPEGRKAQIRGYFAAISAMDEAIGRILDELARLGLEENTIVIFTSDNGMSLGQHGVWGKGNGTFPQNMYNSSVKVPCIISWPGHVPQDRVDQSLLSHYDLFPTFLDVLGLERPETCQPLVGTSFAGLFQGQELRQSDRPVVVYDEYGPVRMIRTKRWKYVMRIPYGPDELYDLFSDPDEHDNRINDPGLQKQRQELREQIIAWFTAYVDPARDASHECNTGYGQLRRVGTKSEGKPVFSEEGPYRRSVQNAFDRFAKPDGQQP